MKILIDIGHPAHIHYFKNIATYFIEKGNSVLFTTRNKDVSIRLLTHYKFLYVNFGKPGKGKISKILSQFNFTFQLLIISIKFNPDIYLNSTQYSAFVSWLLRKPHFSLEDTFNMEQVRLYLPFTNVVFTGDYLHRSLGKKELRYKGYQELMYLHPKHFTSDNNIFEELGVKQTESYFILRFISWNASHDIGQTGLNLEIKRQIVRFLEQYGKVFISSEAKLDEEFEQYRFSLSPERLHHVLAFARLYIGEGATMASECAMLGTPAIYVNSMEAGSIDDQEKFGLIHHFKNGNGVIEKIKELLNDKELKGRSFKAREIMLADKIDVTALLIWFIENYPLSFTILKENPDYQIRFK